MNLFADHLHPILVVCVPFYWIWDDPRMLLFVQAGAIGLTVWILVRAAQRHLPRGAPVATAGVVGCTFGLGLGVQYAAVFDFHEVVLGAPVLATALSALLSDRWRKFLWFSLALLLVKEDAGILVFGLGVVAAIRGRKGIGVFLVAASLVWTWLAVVWIIPKLSPEGKWLYAGTVKGLSSTLRNSWQALIADGSLGLTVLALLAGTAFVALGSNLVLALVPTLMVRMASENPSYWHLNNHYNILVCVVLCFAALDVLTKWDQVRLRKATIALGVLVVVSLVGGPSLRQALNGADPQRVVDAQAMVDAVPIGAPVVADAYLTPHLTSNHLVTQRFRATPPGEPFTDDLGKPLVAKFAVVDLATTSNGGDAAWVPRLLEWLESEGFEVIRKQGDFVLLKRG